MVSQWKETLFAVMYMELIQLIYVDPFSLDKFRHIKVIAYQLYLINNQKIMNKKVTSTADTFSIKITFYRYQ